jgi:putative ABC transport system permease protein
MHGWLQNYAYTINIGLWVFVVTGVSVLLLALVTTGCYSLKLAFAAPVKSLKRE